jgi:hypothetical protein
MHRPKLVASTIVCMATDYILYFCVNAISNVCTHCREIQRLASDFMKDYIFLAVGRVGSASKDVIQTIEYAENEEKFEVLIRTLNKAYINNNFIM